MAERPYELESCSRRERRGPNLAFQRRSAAQASRHLRRRERAIRKVELFSLKRVGPDELSVGAGQEHEVEMEKGAMCSGGTTALRSASSRRRPGVRPAFEGGAMTR